MLADRVVVWARERVEGAKAVEDFVTAVVELSGHILVYQVLLLLLSLLLLIRV